MEALKKRGVALLLAAVVVLASTGVSVSGDLKRESRRISDGFSAGTASAAGYTQPSIKQQLTNLRDVATNVYSMVSDSGDYSALRDAYREMSNVLENKKGIDIDGAYKAYLDLSDELDKALAVSAEAREVYSDTVNGAKRMIGESTYNDTVREFLRDDMGFPANLFAALLDIDMPELFE